MSTARVLLPKTEDKPLPRDLSNAFVLQLNSILESWSPTDPKFRIQRELWLTKFCDFSKAGADGRRKAAIEKWLLTESINQRTNTRLTSSALDFVFEGTISYRSLTDTVRRFVLDVLGVNPSLDLLSGGFSGGATTSRRRSEGHPALKFLDKADATRHALSLFYDLNRGTRWDDHWTNSGLEPRIVRGNALFTVPKNADIDRVAAKEPDINIFLQKMFGNQIRTLLRRKGVNLNDQEVNGELARLGSIDGQLMTIDLSSASDSVTSGLVRLVLPTDWFWYMDLVRSPWTSVDGEWHLNQMFSSMGNGFTFELESLLFYAITKAVAYRLGVKGKISVYGDDIIAPACLFEPLERALAFYGFKVNTTKSFHEGPFRESCGKYWWAGIDVKPFFLRKPLDRLSDLILILNQMSKWASDLGVLDPRVSDLWFEFAQYVPKYLWGGQDFTSRLSLVTGHSPRKELKPVTRVKNHHHIGGLLFWLFIAFERVGIIDEGIAVTSSADTGLSRLRRSRQEWRPLLLPYFPSFLGEYGEVTPPPQAVVA